MTGSCVPWPPGTGSPDEHRLAGQQVDATHGRCAVADRDPTDATQAALARRERLLDGVVQMTAALRADDADEGVWAVQLRHAAEAFAATIVDHVNEAEGPDGLLAQIHEDAPWLSRRAEELRAEHPILRDAAVELLGTWPQDPSPDELRAHVEPLLDRVQQHRHRGTALLVDAYSLDLSAGD
jgi:hypothetical protein